jgi:hypothetical protein
MHETHWAVSCMYEHFEFPINETLTKSTFFSRFHLYYETRHEARHEENRTVIRFDLEIDIWQANVEHIMDEYVILFLSLLHLFLFIHLLSFLNYLFFQTFPFHTTYTPVVLTFRNLAPIYGTGVKITL